jgi:copper chaperone
MPRSATYGVRGLWCVRCVVSAIEEVRALPGVRGVGVDLVPFGESFVTVLPSGVVTPEQVRATLGRLGFEYVGRRRRHHQPWPKERSRRDKVSARPRRIP